MSVSNQGTHKGPSKVTVSLVVSFTRIRLRKRYLPPRPPPRGSLYALRSPLVVVLRARRASLSSTTSKTAAEKCILLSRC